MNATTLKFIYTGTFFVFIFLLGYWLNRSGKPYEALLFNIHKLVALGAVVYLGVTFYKAQHATPLSPLQLAVVALTFLCFVVTIVTGGLVSIEKAMPAAVQLLHKIMPYLTVLSAAASLFITVK